MVVAHDVFAETNPAFCAALISRFCKFYFDGKGSYPSAAVIYLLLPIILSEDISSKFDGCNKFTGLLVWVNRNPDVLLNFSDRVNLTLPMTTDAIRFGCIAGLLEFNQIGEICVTGFNVKLTNSNESWRQALRRVKLLASWFSNAGSVRSVFEVMGVFV